MMATHTSQVKAKEAEIQKLTQSLIKEQMRIAFKELGEMQNNAGFLSEALQQLGKSRDMSVSQEDQFRSCVLLSKIAN